VNIVFVPLLCSSDFFRREWKEVTQTPLLLFLFVPVDFLGCERAVILRLSDSTATASVAPILSISTFSFPAQSWICFIATFEPSGFDSLIYIYLYAPTMRFRPRLTRAQKSFSKVDPTSCPLCRACIQHHLVLVASKPSITPGTGCWKPSITPGTGCWVESPRHHTS
jgi:hypothetical protein